MILLIPLTYSCYLAKLKLRVLVGDKEKNAAKRRTNRKEWSTRMTFGAVNPLII